MLLGSYVLIVIAATVLAKRLWHLLPITVVAAILLTIFSIDLIEGMAKFDGYDLAAIDFVSFWILAWLATLLAALVVYGLKRLVAMAAR